MLASPTRHKAGVTLGALVIAMAGCSAQTEQSGAEEASEESAASATAEFERLEEDYDARLGVYAVDTGSDSELAHRADERFAYASTFKTLLCGALLEDWPQEDLEEVVTYEAADLVPHSPLTEENVDSGMSRLDLCDATIRYSDNTAANLLFDEIGGPEGLQQALEELGDDVTQVAREEVELNEATPGDERDTSTPRAMAANYDAYVLGDVLAEENRALLEQMLRDNTTGDELIRAGLPDGWEAGEKTGAGGYGSRNDVGVLWPPEGDPIVLAVMSSRDEEDADFDNALIAEATEIVVEAMS
jgi:beta-lactamase class A